MELAEGDAMMLQRRDCFFSYELGHEDVTLRYQTDSILLAYEEEAAYDIDVYDFWFTFSSRRVER